MENQVLNTLVMALEAPLTQQANMLDYLPRQARSGAEANIWTGIMRNWAPRWQGKGSVLTADASTFRFKGEARDIPGNQFDLEINLTSANSALIVEHVRNIRIDCILSGNGQQLVYQGKGGYGQLKIEQYVSGSEARFYIQYGLLTLPVHLAF